MVINTKQIGKYCAWLYVFLIFVTSDNITLIISSLILLLGFVFSCLSNNHLKVSWNRYFTLEIAFIIFCALQLITGVAVLQNVAFSATRRLIINLVDEFLLFNILIRMDNEEDIFKALIYPYILGILLIIYLQFASGNIFSYRLTTATEEGVSYQFLGLTINAGASTIVGHCAVCVFAFCMIAYYGYRNKCYLIPMLISIVGIVLSSTRKALVVAAILIIVIPELKVHNAKKLQRIIGAVAIIAIGCFLLMNIPALYNLAGIRLERMFTTLFSGDSVDYSMNVRDNLRTEAWSAFMISPIVGWGVNSFKDLFNNGTIYSHCNYLELLVGTGIIGTLLYLSKYIFLCVQTVKRLKTGSETSVYFFKCFIIWLILTWIMEYWQVVYYNERMIIHYIFVLTLVMKINMQEGQSTLNELL